jgi:hypothetical protein
VGSHLAAIGLVSRSDPAPLEETIAKLLSHSHRLGETADGNRVVYAYDDPSGARATVTLESSRVACLTPSFRPGAVLHARPGTLFDDDCPFERPLSLEVVDDGEMVYPLAVALEDLGVRDPPTPESGTVSVEVVAFAEQLDVFADEAAYRASGTPMAVESLIPSGPLAVGTENATFHVSPRMLMSGVVTAAEWRRNSLFGGAFARLAVRSVSATFEVVIDIGDLRTTAGGERLLPPAGSIVSGQFWLSGRVITEGVTRSAKRGARGTHDGPKSSLKCRLPGRSSSLSTARVAGTSQAVGA